MAQKCEICGKAKLFGHSVSHANNATKRVWLKNINVCTSCLKAGKVLKAARGRHRPLVSA